MAQQKVIDIQVSGLPRLFKQLQWTPKDAQKIGLALLPRAKRVIGQGDLLVPVVTGNLRASGKTKGPLSRSFGFSVELQMEYGGAAAPGKPFPQAQLLPGGRVTYAGKVHDVSSRPRFLTDAFEQEAPAQAVAEQVRLVVERILASK